LALARAAAALPLAAGAAFLGFLAAGAAALGAAAASAAAEEGASASRERLIAWRRDMGEAKDQQSKGRRGALVWRSASSARSRVIGLVECHVSTSRNTNFVFEKTKHPGADARLVGLDLSAGKTQSVRDLARRRAPLVGLPRLRSSRPAAPLRGRALPLALAPSPGLAGGAGAGGRRTPCGVGRRGPCFCAATPRAVGESCRLPLNRTACAPRSLPRMLARRTFTPPPSNPQKMPKKRRNCGRNRHGRGHTRMVDCSHCMCKPAKVRRWERRGG
jgi:hypothetical protein